MLDRIDLASDEDQLDRLIDAFSRAVSSRYMEGEFLPFRMFAMDNKKLKMPSVLLARYEEHRRILQAAIDAGEAGLARRTGYDPLLKLLFPDLARALNGGVATKVHLEYTRANNEKAKRDQETRRALRDARMALVKRGRERQAQLAQREAVTAALNLVRNQYVWQQRMGPPPTPAMLYAITPGKFHDDSLDSLTVFKAAVEGLLSASSVDGVLQELGFKDARDVGAAINLLLKAKLIHEL